MSSWLPYFTKNVSEWSEVSAVLKQTNSTTCDSARQTAEFQTVLDSRASLSLEQMSNACTC